MTQAQSNLRRLGKWSIILPVAHLVLFVCLASMQSREEAAFVNEVGRSDTVFELPATHSISGGGWVGFAISYPALVLGLPLVLLFGSVGLSGGLAGVLSIGGFWYVFGVLMDRRFRPLWAGRKVWGAGTFELLVLVFGLLVGAFALGARQFPPTVRAAGVAWSIAILLYCRHLVGGWPR